MKFRKISNAMIASLVIAATDALPTEFRLFVSGWNKTENGSYLFDEEAASAVMAAFGEHKVDRMIDLEHLSLDSESTSFDPDARGWCSLELRDDGSLWAVNVTWTDDGASRLKEKRQRYISPAFMTDPDTKRVTKIVNIALTALPATHGTPELIAARTRDLRKLSTGLAFADVQAAIQRALCERLTGNPDQFAYCVEQPWICDVFDATAVYSYEGKLWEVAYTIAGTAVSLGAPLEVQRSYSTVAAPPPAAAPAAGEAAKPTTNRSTKSAKKLAANGADMGMDAKTVEAALAALEADDSDKIKELLRGMISSAASGEAPVADPATDDAAAATETDPPAADDQKDKPAEEDQQSVVAATSRLLRITNKTSIVSAIEEVETWRKSHIELEEERKKLSVERATLESAERRKLCVELVTMGAEFPSTVWTDETSTKLKPRWLEMPIAQLRSHAADQKNARGKSPTKLAVTPPTGGGDAGGTDFVTPLGVVRLSARELAMCAEMKVDPKDYAAKKATKKD